MTQKSVDALLDELHRLKQEHSALRSSCEQEMAALRKAAKQSQEEEEKHRQLLESIRQEHKEELKRAAEKIRAGSDKYGALIEHMMEGLLLVDNDDVIEVVNPAFCKMLGYTGQDELIGKTGYEILLKTPDKQRIIRKNKEREDGKSERYEIDLLKKTGESIRVLMNASPVRDKTGEVIGSMSTCIDISEQKQKEIKEEVLFNIANATFVTNDLEELSSAIKGHLSRLIDTSNYYIALYDKHTGMLSIPYEYDEKDNIEEWPAGKSMTGLVVKNREAILMKKPDIMQLIDEGVIEQVGNMCEVWLGVPLLAGDEAIGAVVVQDYDNPDVYDEGSREILEYVSYQISLAIQRKKTIDDLVAAKEKAMESDRLKSAFLANMSHEIRTPMNGILGFAELLKEPGLTNDQQKTYIDIIEKSGVRMLNIINDIVDVSKIEAGLMEVFLAESDVNEQLEYIYSFFQPQVNEKGMQLILSATLPPGQAKVVTDREKLFAILTNLVKNAVKYSKKGYIDFGCRKKGDFLEFFVTDTGMGIPQNRQHAIFDRFVQADIEDKEALQGAGLGLTISKSYVEMLGGSIRVESEPGKGSSFYFTIPFKTS